MGWLVLTRKTDEIVVIGVPPNEIEVMVAEVQIGRVRLAFKVPDGVPINRKEIADRIKAEQ